MAAALPVIAIAGTVVSAIGAVSSARSQANAANYNAQLAERNALIAEQQSRAAEIAQRKQAEKVMGQMRASYGASGVQIEGTPLDILEESAATAEMDAWNIRYNGKLRAMGFTDDAALNRSRASNATTEGYMRAGSSLLIGGARSYDMWQSAPTKPTSGWTSGYDLMG